MSKIDKKIVNNNLIKSILLGFIMPLGTVAYSAVLDPNGDADADGIPNSVEGAFACTDTTFSAGTILQDYPGGVNIPNNTFITQDALVSGAMDITNYYDIGSNVVVDSTAGPMGTWGFNISDGLIISANNTVVGDIITWTVNFSAPAEIELTDNITGTAIMNMGEEYVITFDGTGTAAVTDPDNQLNIVNNAAGTISFNAAMDIDPADATWIITFPESGSITFERMDTQAATNAASLDLSVINHPCSTFDSDGDGIPDEQETDSDADGIPDSVEAGVNPAAPTDTDMDGIPDFQETDSDGDGIPDSVEAGANPATPTDTDMNGTPDYQELDSDKDSIPDAIEGSKDTDGDTVPDFQDLDSDGDGINDSVEVGPNPNNPTDTDGDGIPDFQEAGQAALIANLASIPSTSILSLLGLFGLMLGYLGIYRRK